MCNPASFVVTRKGKVFWSKNTESHEEIIREFDLNEGAAAATGNANFVRVEINPPDNDMRKPLKDWIYKLDEINPPEWYEAKEVEKDCRAELQEWLKTKVILDGQKIEKIEQGQFYIWGGTVSEIRGGTVSEIMGGTVSAIMGGTVSVIWGGTVSEIRGGTVSAIRGGTVSEIRGGTVSEIRGGTVSEIWGGTVSAIWGGTVSAIWGGTVSAIRGGTVSAIRGGTVIAYIKLNKSLLKSDKAVLVDRSGDVVKCYVGKKAKC